MNSATTRLPWYRVSYHPSRSAIRCAFSFLCLILGWLYVNVNAYPLGEESHSGLDGALIAIGAAAVGIWAYLTCPPKPRIQKYLALFLCALNVWLGADTLTKYLLFGVR